MIKYFVLIDQFVKQSFQGLSVKSKLFVNLDIFTYHVHHFFQAQAGWTQHDYGHNSVFPSHKLNKIFHHLVIGHIKVT